MIREYKLEVSNLRNQIKALTAMEGWTLTKLKILFNQKFNKTDSLENLTNKLRNETLKVNEFAQLLQTLGYEIYLRKKIKQNSEVSFQNRIR